MDSIHKPCPGFTRLWIVPAIELEKCRRIEKLVMVNHPVNHLAACHCCGLVHQLDRELSPSRTARCSRCNTVFPHPQSIRKSAERTAAAAAGALILFPPAILLPILEVERLGHHHESSILSGTIDLFHHHEWFVGCIVLLFSIVFPLVKLALLMELSLLGWMRHQHKAITYRAMELLGKWSMMDVLLLALLVMLVKAGDLVHFHFGPGAIAFTVCVVMSMIASLSFNPHAIWEERR